MSMQLHKTIELFSRKVGLITGQCHGSFNCHNATLQQDQVHFVTDVMTLRQYNKYIHCSGIRILYRVEAYNFLECISRKLRQHH